MFRLFLTFIVLQALPLFSIDDPTKRIPLGNLPICDGNSFTPDGAGSVDPSTRVYRVQPSAHPLRPWQSPMFDGGSRYGLPFEFRNKLALYVSPDQAGLEALRQSQNYFSNDPTNQMFSVQLGDYMDTLRKEGYTNIQVLEDQLLKGTGGIDGYIITADPPTTPQATSSGRRYFPSNPCGCSPRLNNFSGYAGMVNAGMHIGGAIDRGEDPKLAVAALVGVPAVVSTLRPATQATIGKATLVVEPAMWGLNIAWEIGHATLDEDGGHMYRKEKEFSQQPWGEDGKITFGSYMSAVGNSMGDLVGFFRGIGDVVGQTIGEIGGGPQSWRYPVGTGNCLRDPRLEDPYGLRTEPEAPFDFARPQLQLPSPGTPSLSAAERQALVDWLKNQ